MLPGAPLLAYDEVSVAYDGVTVLDAVSFVVPAEGITVIMGPSGSGKSTLLRLANRLEVPTTGVVRFRGEDVAQLDPLRLRRALGMVFQQPVPFPGSGRDNLVVAAPDATDDELVALLDRVGLEADFLERDTDALSGGEAQRLCLARALAAGPDALLMDEPTSALDVDSAATIERLAVALATAGIPQVWVTHDPEQARRLASNRIELREGRVVLP